MTDNKIPTVTHLPPECAEWVKEQATKDGRTVSAWLRAKLIKDMKTRRK